MKLTSTLFRWLSTMMLVFWLGNIGTAQDSCTFRLRVYDQVGDGWDGSFVYVRSGATLERGFAHTGITANAADSVRFFDIRVRRGDSIFIRYAAAGSTQGQIRYSLLNNLGDPIFAAGPSPATGIVYRGVVKCITCGVPVNPTITARRAFSATLNWLPARNGTEPQYKVTWDTTGFTPQLGRSSFLTSDTVGILSGLTEITRYQVYIQTVCAGNDSSDRIGPIAFTTDTANNLGVVSILSPQSKCDLGVDSVRILIKNFGGAPQQLFNYRYSINGVAANIQTPTDGLYTGVLSKDSTVTLAFKALGDFTQPGEYEILAWTDLTGDRNRANDTARVTVVKSRTVSTYPYAQNFELGKDTWRVVDSTGNTTWEFGTPAGPVIKTAASGSNAWTTDKAGTYKNNEYGFVVSPCLDFSSFTADPRILMNVNVNSEAGFDGMWLEMSTDNGDSWEPVGYRRTGVNWYNDTLNGIGRAAWGGIADSTKGWRLAQHVLTGSARKPNVRLRMGFRSDGSVNAGDGAAFDNVFISEVPAQDLAVSELTSVGSVSCFDSVLNVITVKIANLGQTRQFRYNLSYQTALGGIVTEPIDSLNINPGQTVSYTFTKPFKTVTVGNYPIKAWVTLASDQFKTNDTVSTSLNITLEKPLNITSYPYFQDFESGTGTWSVVDSLQASSWTIGQPAGTRITSAFSGTNVWTTTLSGTYTNGEWGFLLSPCLDFSRFTTDPRISFALNTYSERNFDGMWLEASTDTGKTWNRIGTRNTGVNWYRDSITTLRRGVWSGRDVQGWQMVQNTLTGLAGKSNVRLRFAFRADGSVNTDVNNGGLPYDGVAVDNILISAAPAIDFATASANRTNTSDCGIASDSVLISFTNLGTSRQFRYTAHYRVDNGPVITENIDSLNVVPGATATYRFNTPFNSTALGAHTITAWVKVAGDTVVLNDTLRANYEIFPASPNSIVYNFDNGLFPRGVAFNQGTGFVSAAGVHGVAVGNGVAYSQVTSTNRNTTFITPQFGVVKAGDSLSFDYRIVNATVPFAAYTMTTSDTIFIQLATNCSDVYSNIDTVRASKHVQSTNFASRRYSLTAFAGSNVRLRLFIKSATTSTTGYFVDIDNINYQSVCPASFNATATIKKADAGRNNGSIKLNTPSVGVGPFTYRWSNARTTDSIGGLAPGIYTVTITDSRGCFATQSFEVQQLSSLDDPSVLFNKITVAPNPTSGNAVVFIDMARPTPARVQVINLVGQVVMDIPTKGFESEQVELELYDRPAGVYLIRIVADNRTHVSKLIKQ